MQENQIKAVLYARVSSREQSEGYSIDAQVELIREYASKHKITLVREFIEIESAKEAGRPGFDSMVHFLSSNGIESILVEKTDRLYRNIKDWVTIDELGVDVHLVKEGMVVGPSARSSDRFFHGIRVLMAKNYIDNLREETLKGMNQKAIKGGWSHRAPRGYRMVAGKLEIDPDEAEKVKWFFYRYAEGKVSVVNLIKESGENLIRSRLYAQLHHPIYCGLIPWKGNLYKGIHKPLVDRATWDHVQHLLTSRAKGHSKQKEITYRKLIHCGHCGCLLTAERKKEKFVYYRCTESHGKCKENGYIPQPEMNLMFGATLDEMNTNREAHSMNDTIILASADELKRLFHEGNDWMKRRVTKALCWNSVCTSGALSTSLVQPFENLRKRQESGRAALTGIEPVSPP